MIMSSLSGNAMRALREHQLFAALNAEQWAMLDDAVHEECFTAGEPLFRMGETAAHFFFVASGRIKLYRLSPSGQEKIIELVSTGQTFAEAVMFMDKRNFPVNAAAIEDSRLLSINSEVFLKILRQSPDACLKMLGGMSVRLRQKLNEIEALSLQNSKLRVAHFLLQQSTPANQPKVHLDAPKKVIASRLSIQPETLSRILHELRELGAISMQGREITLINRENLESFIADQFI